MSHDPSSDTARAADLRPLSPVRRVVARRMTEAWQTIPAVTLQRSVAFGALLELRGRLADGERKPAIDTLLARIVALALTEHDRLNGSWREESRAVLVHPERNVAIAVDTPRGLTIVVLGRADARTIPDLDADLRAMVLRARDGRSLPADVEGATFTITNLGALGVEAFNPIITPPQCAVLGVGALHATAAGSDQVTLSLTFDHRVVDGADAARFLARVVELIATPNTWFGRDGARSA
jgi:pyruvate dehydrogenase E2 component (dihydrolipoamide acetyltransferase)